MTSGKRDASFTTAALILGRALAAATTVAASHLLPVEELARYLVAMTVAIIAIPLVDAGFGQWTRIAVAREPGRPLYAVTASTIVTRLPLWVGLVTIACVAGALGSFGAWFAAVTVLAAVAQASTDVMTGERFARQQFRAGVLVQVTPPATAAIATILALSLLPATAEVAMATYAIARILPPAFILLRNRPRPDRVVQPSFRDAAPFAAISVVIVLYTRSDVLILSHFDTAPELISLYALAYTVLNAMQMLPGGISAALLPRVAATKESEEHRGSLAASTAVTTSMIGAVIALPVFLFPELAFAVFGGVGGVDASRVAPVFLVISAVGLSQVAYNGLLALGRATTVVRLLWIAAALNVVACWLLVSEHGVTGALLATTTTEASIAVIALFLLRVSAGRYAAVGIASVGICLLAPIAAAAGTSPLLVAGAMTCGIVGTLATDAFGARSRLWQPRRAHKPGAHEPA